MQLKLAIGLIYCFFQLPTLLLQRQLSENNDLPYSASLFIAPEKDAETINLSTSRLPIATVDVLFATNEDCELYINNEPKGFLSKTKFLYLKLTPGTYTYRAKSKTTGDELNENFVVAEGGMNEIFMDLLYTIDEKALEKKTVKSKTPPSSKPTAEAKKRVTEKEKVPVRIPTSAEKQQNALASLVSAMVPLEKGGFIMGNNRAPAADEVEHSVTISPILFGKYEVTQEQWESIMGYNPSLNGGCGKCPVENISWEEATIFTRKLNAISDKKFRLPTEAEWEYVARKGGREEVEKAGGQEAYIKKTAWYFANANGKTNPVGSKQPNVLGIYDLTGNVSEWCMDWYGAYYYKEDYSQKDPDGPPLGKEKVIRGGNYKDFVGDRFRPSFRNKRKPTEKSSEVGLRLVMEAD